MVEMNDHRAEIERHNHETIDSLEGAIKIATEVITGESGRDPLEVFPDPSDKERRMDVEFDDLDDDTEARFRLIMSEIGVGRLGNKGAEAVGLLDEYVALIEGGLGHKMAAELSVVLTDNVQPSTIIIAASKYRELPDTEKQMTATVFGWDETAIGNNEYEVAEQLIRSLDGFVAQDKEELAYGYDDNFSVTTDPTGQFVLIGSIEGKPVVLMSVEQKPNQPNNGKKIKIVAEILRQSGERKAIGIATSSTYEAEILLQTIDSKEDAYVISYGMDELGRTKGKPSKPPALNQLAGGAGKLARSLAKLK